MRRTIASWTISILGGVVVGSVGGFLALQALSGPRRGAAEAPADLEPSRSEVVQQASAPATGGTLGTPMTAPSEEEALPPQDPGAAARQDEIHNTRRTAIVTATERVRGAVVTVYVVERVQRRPSIFDSFFDVGPREYEQAGLGSGLVVSSDGYILTNDHVVGSADKITVQLGDGREFEGVVVDTDPGHDLAVLKIDPPDNLPVAELGDSSDIMVGEWVIALGSPFGFYLNANDPRPSVSVGVVSAVGRSFVTQSAGQLRYFPGTIQTDAAINPGNSGGPLVNALGRVIGVNSFIYSQSGGSVGIGFAIPINQAKEALAQIRQYGYLRRAWTGLKTVTNDSWYVARNRVAAVRGALVWDVERGSPAEKAGLNQGCVIIEAGGKQIQSEQDLEEVLVQADIGDVVEIVYYSYPESRRQTTSLTLEEEPRSRR